MDTVTINMEEVSKGADSTEDMETTPGPSDISKGTCGEKTGESMDLPYKRPSGAQKKKLRREAKIKAGTWLEKKPAQLNKKEVVPGKESGFKRTRSDSSTPTSQKSAPKRARKPPGQTASYSGALKGISLAVIQRRHPDVTLDQAQSDLIQEKLLEAVDKTPSGSTNPPQFDGTWFSAGVLRINCTNEHTKKWLSATVASLGNIWEGADLTVVESKDLPKRPKVIVWIPGNPELEAVKTRMGVQNPGLQVGDWHLLSKKKEKEGVLLAFSVNEVDHQYLEAHQMKAHYGLQMVTFRKINLNKQSEGNTGKPAAQ